MSAGAPAAPTGTTAPATTPATSSPASAPTPATNGAPAAPQVGAPRPGAPNGKPLTAAEERYLFKRAKEDGTVEDIDISDYRHKVKIDGKEHELSIRDMSRLQGLEKASFRRFEEANQLKSQVTQQTEKLKQAAAMLNDPNALLDHLEERYGEQVYGLLQERVANRIRYEKLDPRERARQDSLKTRERDFQTREQRIKADEARIAQEKAARRVEAGKAQAAKWAEEWPHAFESKGLPQNERVIQMATERTVSYLRRAAKNNVRMSIDEAQDMAVKDVREALGGIIKGVDPAVLRQIVGDEGIAKFAGAQSAAIEAQPGRRQEPVQRQPEPTGGPKKSLSDIMEEMRKR